MKLTYRRIGLFISTAGLLFFLSQFSFFSSVVDILLVPLRPIQSRIYIMTTAVNNFFSRFFIASQLDTRVKELTEQNIRLSQENARLSQLELENQTLKNLLAFKERRPELNITPARVVGRAPREETVLNINKGRNFGLKPGQAVISDTGIVIGKIIRADEFTAQLMLLTDSRHEISASLLKTNSPSGIVTGEKGLSVKLQLIPNNIDLTRDDLIVTSGLEPEIPNGLIIGRIEEIIRQPTELFQEAIVKTLIPLNNISIVAIVIK